MNAHQPAPLPHQITVIAYPDSLVEAHGYGPDHPYILECILPVIGPSTTLLWMRLAQAVLDASTNPVVFDVADLVACLGLGDGLAKNSPAARTVARMVGYDLARQAGRYGTLLAVRTALAAHPEHRARRLPATARRYHDHTTRPANPAAVPDQVTVTPAAATALARTHTDVDLLVFRHRTGDWGDVTLDEAIANNTAHQAGGTLRSRYQLDVDTAVIVTTSPDRAATTITTPDHASPGER